MWGWIVGVACLLAPWATAVGQEQRVAFTDAAWDLQGQGTVVQSYLDRTALRIRSGRAVDRHLAFDDGTIEFDLAVTPHRSFVSVQFRMQSDEEHEEIYFRPHKSELPDAIQYTPVYHGASNWQLYHTAGFTAATPLPPGEWIHVRIVVRGPKAAVFVGDMGQPKMVVQHLARAPAAGYLALGSSVPAGGAPEGVYAANFSNLVVRPGDVTFEFPKSNQPPLPGLVTSWDISPVVSASDDPIQTVGAASDVRSWRRLDTDSEGLLVLGKYVAVPDGVRRPAVLARLRIRAERAMIKRLNLGYSDDAIVAVNGVPLFYASDSYSFTFPRRDGLIGLDQAAIYLPLVEGDNEVVVGVSDVFGGWGIMGQLPDRTGLTLH
jgi:hypothetical protein